MIQQLDVSHDFDTNTTGASTMISYYNQTASPAVAGQANAWFNIASGTALPDFIELEFYTDNFSGSKGVGLDGSIQLESTIASGPSYIALNPVSGTFADFATPGWHTVYTDNLYARQTIQEQAGDVVKFRFIVAAPGVPKNRYWVLRTKEYGESQAFGADLKWHVSG